MATRWTDAGLRAARRDGDPEADALVERILDARDDGGGVTRHGYNHLLDLATVLVAHPELALVPSSLLALVAFLVTSAIIFVFVMRFVNRPIQKLIAGTESISRGDYSIPLEIDRQDEMGQLAAAMNFMCQEIGQKQTELNRQRDEYLNLFNTVPCIITVQDRNYRLLQYNREFSELFAPRLGDYCYQAYKGRTSKCINCPVEKTFQDGMSHDSEEAGIHKDGSPAYWLVKTSPIRNAYAEVVAAMEVNLDITNCERAPADM